MPKRENPQTDKVAERKLPSGIAVEYYCSKGGPSAGECLERAMRIAADALMRQQL